ncbi:MAG: 3-phosphoshikimate 1-carboxyvinyltransferase [Oscillospiraceae bacterium]|jgi:3-phosphoshikimate 1-carboxyvinyltransferase|nr:3-phosphoshikimate 1-carboxyvinyltransferase [Oscillospiraceae bacterium]
MNITIHPRRLGGEIRAIASKSQAHRLLICAAFADKPTKIVCAELSQDIEASVRCLTALGADISYIGACFHVHPIEMPAGDALLDCGESGATLRFLLPIVAALGVSADFVLRGRLSQRPLSPLWELLEAHGCRLSRPSADTLHCEGRLRSGSYAIAGNISSQFISGLLFALPLCGAESNIMLTTECASASYIGMTLSALRSFAIAVDARADGWHLPAMQRYQSPGRVRVEGDWSNAAFWLCAGAVSSEIVCTNLDSHSPQGDRAIFDILERFGATLSRNGDCLRVSRAALQGIELDASDIPDLVPPIALLATQASGATILRGVERLRIKESDRLESICGALRSLGAKVEIAPDTLIIHESTLRGGSIDSCNDHRIAMLAAIASSVCTESIHLRGADAVRKSYPRFWEDFRTLGGQKEEDA